MCLHYDKIRTQTVDRLIRDGWDDITIDVYMEGFERGFKEGFRETAVRKQAVLIKEHGKSVAAAASELSMSEKELGIEAEIPGYKL